jgi:hypothetical protein
MSGMGPPPPRHGGRGGSRAAFDPILAGRWKAAAGNGWDPSGIDVAGGHAPVEAGCAPQRQMGLDCSQMPSAPWGYRAHAQPTERQPFQRFGSIRQGFRSLALPIMAIPALGGPGAALGGEAGRAQLAKPGGLEADARLRPQAHRPHGLPGRSPVTPMP